MYPTMHDTADGTFIAAGRSKVHDPIAASIGIDIATGVLPEGTILSTEVEAIERLKVSRTAYREALRVLAGKGMVSTRTKVGTSVNPRQAWSLFDPDVLRWMFSRRPTMASVKQLFELRMIIEPSAAEAAALRRSPQQLSAMGHALEEMARYGLASSAGQKADSIFHTKILEATGNEFLIALTQPIATAIRWTTELKFAASSKPRNPMPLHRDLFSAIVERDGALAREVAVQLLVQARDDTEAIVMPGI
jgi:DNA-binding FadR family transcriptional regulator